MSSLLDSLKERISPDVISGLAANLGESSGSIQTALQTSGAAMLAALAGKASDTGFLSQIMNLISGSGFRSAMGATAGAGSSVTSSVSSAASQASSSFLNMLFGGNLSSMQSKIAEVSGLRSSAAGTILASAVPMVLGTVASKVNSEGLSASGLGNVLSAELPKLRSFLPAGFAIPGVPGLSAVTSQVAHVRDEIRPKATGWLMPAVIVGVLVLAGLIWYFSRTNAVNNAVNTASTAATQAGNAVSNGASALGAFFQSSLPNGVTLNIPENGVENKLLIFIKDPNTTVNTETWFDFDRLLFDTNSATLQPSSQEQLQNIANILKAYPNVHIRIGGYTDNQGDAAANLKLSQDRADNVMHEIVVLGVDPSRMDAKGYGEDHPVADNSTEAGRAQNRRISMRVTQK
jgi:outer membrane protein OmpA-like peptidoglycan-associated protein